MGCNYTKSKSPTASTPNPFNKLVSQQVHKLTHSLLWVEKVITGQPNSSDHLDDTITELVPYDFNGSETIEVGPVQRRYNRNLVRYQLNSRIDRKLRVVLEIHTDTDSNIPWEYLRVSAFLNEHEYTKTYYNRITK